MIGSCNHQWIRVWTIDFLNWTIRTIWSVLLPSMVLWLINLDQFLRIKLSADFGAAIASMINPFDAVSFRRIDNAFANDWTRLDTVLIHQFGLRITNRASDIATCRQIGNQLLKHGSTADCTNLSSLPLTDLEQPLPLTDCKPYTVSPHS